jgi:hypothetical protein
MTEAEAHRATAAKFRERARETLSRRDREYYIESAEDLDRLAEDLEENEIDHDE